MPYIKHEERKKFDVHLNEIQKIETKGQLEYCIFKLMVIYMNDKEGNYSNYHDVVYAAVHSGDEFRRRFLDEREKIAMFNNGDIV